MMNLGSKYKTKTSNFKRYTNIKYTFRYDKEPSR